jgi:uncharacterized membrane protein
LVEIYNSFMMSKPRQCAISGKEYPQDELYKGSALRKSLLDLIRKDHPDFNPDSYISLEEVNIYRKKYLESLIENEVGELSHLENEVVNSIAANKLISDNIEIELDRKLTFGERLSDRIADFGGSWTFIIIFFMILFIWIAINVWLLTSKPFDPYPFILLNLILSCLASIQAPIIMMSQNRKESRDRLRSENDYKINLKAELEIRVIHEKLDHMVAHQNQKMLEIQEIQADFLEDIMKMLKNNEGAK